MTVRGGVRATGIDAEGVTIEAAGETERIAARTAVWAAGVRAAGLGETLAKATGASTDRAGRIEVGPDLTVPGHPEISAIGDMTSLAGSDGRPLPGLATVAVQQARHVAKAIKNGEPGASTPFRYLDKGALAVVGRGKAVCEVRGLELSGRIAFANRRAGAKGRVGEGDRTLIALAPLHLPCIPTAGAAPVVAGLRSEVS